MAEFTDEQLAIIDRRFRRLLRDVRRQEQLKGHVSQLDPLKVALQGSGDDVYVTSRAAGLQLVSGDAVKLTKTPAGYHVDGRALADDVIGSVETHTHTKADITDLGEPLIAYEDTIISVGSTGSFISGTPALETTFVAPTSGRVLIGVSCHVDTVAGTSATVLIASYNLGTTQGGSEVQAETLFERSARYQVFSTTSAAHGGGVAWAKSPVLTPGQTYYLRHRVQQLAGSGGPVNVRGRKLIVM